MKKRKPSPEEQAQLWMQSEAATEARARYAARAVAAADLKEQLTPQPAEAPGMDFRAELEKMIKGIKVTPPAEIRAHEFRTVIVPKLDEAGIEERYWIDGMLAGGDPRAARQRDVLTKMSKAASGVGAIVTLAGPRGTGKTTIAAQLAQDRFWADWETAKNPQGKGVPVTTIAYIKMVALIARLKPFYGDFGSIREEKLETWRRQIGALHLVILDELSDVKEDSKFGERVLTDIIDIRYARRRDTILITNATAAHFEESINPSILSRLNEHGGILECEWESFREVPAQ